jgi:hypothetical protein
MDEKIRGDEKKGTGKDTGNTDNDKGTGNTDDDNNKARTGLKAAKGKGAAARVNYKESDDDAESSDEEGGAEELDAAKVLDSTKKRKRGGSTHEEFDTERYAHSHPCSAIDCVTNSCSCLKPSVADGKQRRPGCTCAPSSRAPP